MLLGEQEGTRRTERLHFWAIGGSGQFKGNVLGGRTWQHIGGFLGVRRGSSSLKVALLGVVEGGLVILKVAFLGDRRESSSRKVTFLGGRMRSLAAER